MSGCGVCVCTNLWGSEVDIRCPPVLNIFIILMCVGILPACLPVHHVCTVPKSPEKVLCPLKLLLQGVVRHLVGAGIKRMISEWTVSAEHLSSPYIWILSGHTQLFARDLNSGLHSKHLTGRFISQALSSARWEEMRLGRTSGVQEEKRRPSSSVTQAQVTPMGWAESESCAGLWHQVLSSGIIVPGNFSSPQMFRGKQLALQPVSKLFEG